MRKILSISLTLIVGLFVASRVFAAQELIIEGNGSGSENQIVVSSGAVVNVTQGNSATITNDINASANTGRNNISGSSGSITTGNATTTVNINNVVNSNITNPTPKPTLNPTLKPTQSPADPAPTSVPASGSSGSSSNSSSSNQSSLNNVGGAQVLGLSATSGELDYGQIILSLSGVICLGLAAYYLRAVLHS